MSETPKKLYAERDHEAQGEYYMRHLEAMTAKKLHSKSDIAAELAHRDILIVELREALSEILAVYDRQYPNASTTYSDKANAALAKAKGTP